jgi:hypothetical protein
MLMHQPVLHTANVTLCQAHPSRTWFIGAEARSDAGLQAGAVPLGDRLQRQR